MDTIDSSVLDAAAIVLPSLGFRYVCTVTIELNGQHGGADMIVTGFDSNDVSLYNERTERVVLR